MPGLFDPLTIRGVTLRNRVGVSPMCQYSSEGGFAGDWHLVHLGARAVGGAGLVVMEDTAVTEQGRISPGDNGLWSDAHVGPLARITRFIAEQGAVPGVQLGHAGRKGSTGLPWDGGKPGSEGPNLEPGGGAWETIAPSETAHGGRRLPQVPREMNRDDIAAVQDAFRVAARRALEAGFRLLKLHASNGYLCHQFYSPLANKRTDDYGGSLENRCRFTVETVRAIRREWPEELPLSARIATSDFVDGGWTPDEAVELARRLKDEGADLIDCMSSGGVAPGAKFPDDPGFIVEHAEAIRRGAGVAVSASMLTDLEHGTDPEPLDAHIRGERLDMVFLAREVLRNPYWPAQAAATRGLADAARLPIPYSHWLGDQVLGGKLHSDS